MNFNINKNRIETFSDGVIAIIITIMVLELHLPEINGKNSGHDLWNGINTLMPQILSYLLSFIVVAIMWINHHSLFDTIPYATSTLVWWNTFLLFAMSLIPLPTQYIARYPLLPEASAFYGAIMFLNALAFLFMRRYVAVKIKNTPTIKILHKSNFIGTSLYLLTIPLSFISVHICFIIFIGIPLWYFIPDKFHK